jgi:hypothetical protein
MELSAGLAAVVDQAFFRQTNLIWSLGTEIDSSYEAVL